jgi:trk system potassium uptake protein TrkA
VKAVVVGAGEVGYHVAERLSREGHDIVVVDDKGHRLEYVQAHLDVGVVEGNGASPSVLARAGIDTADILVAVTSVDEVNLVCCAGVRSRPGMTKIARVSNPDFYSGGSVLQPGTYAVDVMINPERELALETFRLLQSTAATDIAVFAEGALQVMSLPVIEGAPAAGKSLARIASEIGDVSMLTAAIDRNGQTLVPTGASTIEVGDRVYLVVTPGTIGLAHEQCGHKRSTLKRVMIAGGSVEAYYLGQLLRQHQVQATLLVADRERAQELAEKLDKALVLNGDATDVELLELEGVGGMDAFVALTDQDQNNILSALVAKHAGAKQVITLVNKIEYVPLARRIGLDAAVSPRLSAANAIMGHIRRGSVTKVSTFKHTEAEAISFNVSAQSPIISRPLADIELPEGTLVAAISRGGQVIVPRGRDTLEAGDTAIIFALPDAVADVVKLFPG